MMMVERLVLGVRLVALDLLRFLPRKTEAPLTGAVGADRGEGQQLVEVGALAGRAGGRRRGEYQELELVVAPAAFVFVDWHLPKGPTATGLQSAATRRRSRSAYHSGRHFLTENTNDVAADLKAIGFDMQKPSAGCG